MEIITKVKNKNYRLDITNNRITFLDSRLYYHENGNYYPSVTSILDCYPKSFGFYEWLKRAGEDADSIRDEAGNRGSIVHTLTERYDNGEEICLLNSDGEISIRMNEWNMLEKYISFRKRFNIEIEEMELNLVSEKLQFGGTIDRIINIDGKRILMDIKTSNAIYNHYWLQVTAYAKLYQEETGGNLDGIAILWLNSKTRTEGKAGSYQGPGYQMAVQTNQEEINHYWKLFLSTQILWMEENANFQPKQVSYQLKHKL